MNGIQKFRQQYPGAYDDVPDDVLAGKLYDKFYAGNMDRADFDQRMGLYSLETHADAAAARGDTEAQKEIEDLKSSQDGSEWSIPAQALASFAEGGTFGWNQEAYAKMDETRGKGSYDDRLKAWEGEYNKISPWVRIPGNIAGGIAGTAALSGLAPALPVMAPAIKYGLLGAGEGAISGAGYSPDDRLGGAAIGGVLGGALGVAAPYLAQGVKKLWHGVTHPRKAPTQGAARLSKALTQDGDTPEALMSRYLEASKARPDASLADAGGDAVKGILEDVAQNPGAGRSIVVDRLTKKQQGQIARISSDLKSLSGTSKTAYQSVVDVMGKRAQEATPLYKEAFEFDASQSPQLVKAWEAATQTGWGKALLNSKNLKKTLQTKYGFSDHTKAPLMAVVDAWKDQADDLIGASIRKGQNHQASVLTAMKNNLLQVVDDANPAYAQARSAWAGHTQFLNQIDEGKNILSSKVSAEEFVANFAKLNGSEKEAYRLGAISTLINKMESVSYNLPDLTKALRSPAMRAKIAAMMPTEEASQKWLSRLEYEINTSETARRALGNSATARRQALRSEAEDLVRDLTIDFISGSPHGSTSIIGSVLRQGSKFVGGKVHEKSRRVLGDLLTKPHPEMNSLLSELQKQATPVDPNTLTAITAGGAQAAAPRDWE
jgi:hypothetical protein